ncbi:F-box only protein 21-like isoform X1 [Limulus polyphemus]|uniref:F-box only protein 21-like isoform X1 n=1 Tax=Limulus polyphemus TaxID=6850 RepID=A0ABM1TE56_LIMPO|nr:F-box only protein 21-like isoform X1 [Limulus polyphemus]
MNYNYPKEDFAPKIDLLPQELLEHVLCLPFVSFKDICRFSCVCSKFRNAGNSNEVWRCKFTQSYSALLSNYSRSKVYTWKEEYMERYLCGLNIRKVVSSMSERFYHKDDIADDDFECILQNFNHPFSQQFIVHELVQLSDLNCIQNLTEKYYAEKILRYVGRQYLEKRWLEYLALPNEKQTLEKGAILFAQWCNPTTNIQEDVTSQLDHLSQLVREELQQSDCNHPLLQINQEEIDIEATESLWLPRDCRAILTSLNVVLFHHLKFQQTRADQIVKSYYIHEVLKTRTGNLISLGILYIILAKRLGVSCFPVFSPQHFLLKWLQNPELSVEQQYSYIDISSEGKFVSRGNCPYSGHQTVKRDTVAHPETPLKIIEKISWDLVDLGRQIENVMEGQTCMRNGLELLNLLTPEDDNSHILLARVYNQLGINLVKVLSIVKEVSARNSISKRLLDFLGKDAKRQLAAQRIKKSEVVISLLHSNYPEVKYAVGMIMKHCKYHYTCVIYGWDPICKANGTWIHQMGVHTLVNKERQPFYHVLVEDGSNRYAAQENLKIADFPRSIQHPMIGKYFQSFCMTYYIPNKEKEAEYPEDNIVRNRFFGNMQNDTQLQNCVL